MALTDNLISYWKLNETSGTRSDSYGSNHLTDNNTVTYEAGLAALGNAAVFDAANTEFLNIADGSQSGLDFSGSFSYQLWIKPQTWNSTRSVLARDKLGSRALIILMYASNEATYPNSLWWYINDTSGQHVTTALTMNQWYHVVCTYEYITSGTSKMNIYVNGSLGVAEKTNAVGPMINSSGDLQLGAREYTISRIPWSGSMQHVVAWSRKLTSAEVTELFNGGLGYDFLATPTVDNPRKFIFHRR